MQKGDRKRKFFPYEGAKKVIPQFWREHFRAGKGKVVCGQYGIHIDEKMGDDTFEHLIADPYTAGKEIPEEFIIKKISALTWVVFPCAGPMPRTLQDVNTRIFTEWLPTLLEYEFASGYCVEMYDEPSKHPHGTQDKTHYCEIWIPVKRK